MCLKAVCARQRTGCASRGSSSMRRAVHIYGRIVLTARLDDIFDLQDELTASVVGAIAPKLEQAEIERAKRKPTGSLDAYDYYLRGLANLRAKTREAGNEALRLFYKAIELDPDFASAYGMAAWCYLRRKAGWMVDPVQETSEAAGWLDGRLSSARRTRWRSPRAGVALAFVVGELDAGVPSSIGHSCSIQIWQLHGPSAAGSEFPRRIARGDRMPHARACA